MIILQAAIYRLDLRSNPSIQFVFGDNEVRQGYAGQALEMRGEPNAIGIATSRAPSVPWTDKNAAHQCRVIDTDLARLLPNVLSHWPIVWPRDHIGLDLAVGSPLTFTHLGVRLRQLMEWKIERDALDLHDALVTAGEVTAYQLTRTILGTAEGLIEEDAP